MNSQALCGAYVTYTLQGVFLLEEIVMSNEKSIQVITTSELLAQLQSLDDHAILTIVLEEGDDEDGED